MEIKWVAILGKISRFESLRTTNWGSKMGTELHPHTRLSSGPMTRTPWGDATELRERMLRPGRGTPREEAEKNQRERLLAAMVATVADHGYEATPVADLVKLSGVSRTPSTSTSPTRRSASWRPPRR